MWKVWDDRRIVPSKTFLRDQSSQVQLPWVAMAYAAFGPMRRLFTPDAAQAAAVFGSVIRIRSKRE
jgi:hypothetical protein